MGANCCGSSASTTTEIAVPTIPPHESEQELVDQVTKIQAAFRGHKVRKEYENGKDAKEDENSKNGHIRKNQKNEKDPRFIVIFYIFLNLYIIIFGVPFIEKFLIIIHFCYESL